MRKDFLVQLLDQKPKRKTSKRPENVRIHVSAGQLVGVLDKSLVLNVHQDPLTTDGADVVGQTPAGHASLVVVLRHRDEGVNAPLSSYR